MDEDSESRVFVYTALILQLEIKSTLIYQLNAKSINKRCRIYNGDEYTRYLAIRN